MYFIYDSFFTDFCNIIITLNVQSLTIIGYKNIINIGYSARFLSELYMNLHLTGYIFVFLILIIIKTPSFLLLKLIFAFLSTGGHDPPNGVIERRYGYIPNPRWRKFYPTSSNRNFEPKGIRGSNYQVPWVTFRGDRKETGHSYQEKDFPELASVSSDQ